jgi:hypothetical protein
MENLLKQLIEAVERQGRNNRDAIFGTSWRDQTVAVTLLKRELERSADYVEENMPDATCMTSGDKGAILNFLANRITLKGHIAQFGVWKGESINHLASVLESKTIWGFDSFFGLEEDFSIDYLKGGFNLNGIPPLVRKNVSLVKGSFAKSLPIWLNQNPGEFAFMHIDCDTYQATKTVFDLVGPKRIVSGTVILFDEYFGFYGWRNHEFKAWQEYCAKHGVKYKYVAISGMQVLVEVL